MITPRKRDAEGNFLPDPPLGLPYPGYSMMEMIRWEHAHPLDGRRRRRSGFGYQAP